MNLREIRKLYPTKPDCCQRCRLFLECTSYKIPMRQLHSGTNGKKVLIVAMNPGKDEDKQNKILVGRSGQLLDTYIKEYFSDYDVWATNAVKCYNPNTKLKIDHIRYCNKFLLEDINNNPPNLIIAMGDIAKQAVNEATPQFILLDSVADFPEIEYTHHPAYVLRGNPDDNIRNTFIRVDATLRDELVKIPYQPWDKGIVEKILRRSYDTKHIAIDFEWDITDNNRCHTVGFSSDLDCTATTMETGRYLISELFANPDITLVGHNIKEDTKRAIEMGLITHCKFQDTLVLTRELTPWIMKKKLSNFCEDYLLFPRYWSNITTDDYKEYSPRLAEYCAGDCFAAYKLYENYMTDFGDELEVMWEANQIDMAMVYPTALMELQGIKLDINKAMQYKGELETDVLQLENKIQDEYGVNPGSPSQVKDKLTELGFDVKNTSRETLVGIDHEFVRNILQFRKMDKLVDTYYKPLPELVDKDGILHTSLHICGMITGRMGCVTADTAIDMPRDLTVYPDGVPITQVTGGDWVYSVTWDKRLVLRRVKWVGCTGQKRVIKVTVRNKWGEVSSIRLTDDHLVRMYTGVWKPAGTLRVGSRLMGMVRRHIDSGYSQFFPTALRRVRGESGGRAREHRWIYAQLSGYDKLPGRWDVHHKDGNTLNNHPDNLELVYHSSHIKMHKQKTPPETVQAMLDGTIPQTLHPRTVRRLAQEYGLLATNHTVIAVEQLGTEEVWDMEVEDTHTFIGNGIALHNSSKPNLQNIPKSRRDMICSIYGDEGVLVSADRSQSEYRCLVYMAQHKDLIDEYLDNPNLDMHQWASDVLGVDRYTAKTMNFAALYGASRWRLVKELVKKGMTEYDAGEKVDRYLPQILAFSRYQSGLVSFYNQHDYIQSPYGRRFYSLDGRQIANYPVQSFSADLNKKLSVLYLFNEMKRLGLRSRIWLEFHDSCEIDMYLPERDIVLELLRSVPVKIPDVLGYGVELPLPISIKEHGRYWS